MFWIMGDLIFFTVDQVPLDWYLKQNNKFDYINIDIQVVLKRKRNPDMIKSWMRFQKVKTIILQSYRFCQFR